MEESAFNAIYIGIYVFVFIIAVTATMFLYNSISDYADLAYEYSHNIDGEPLIIGSEAQRNKIITGSEVVNYYYNYVKKDKYNETDEIDYIVSINLNGKNETPNMLVNTDLTYKELVQQIGISDNYILEYVGQTADGKGIINISKITSFTDEGGDTLQDEIW